MDALQQVTDPNSLGAWVGALNVAITIGTFVVAFLICLCAVADRRSSGGKD